MPRFLMPLLCLILTCCTPENRKRPVSPLSARQSEIIALYANRDVGRIPTDSITRMADRMTELSKDQAPEYRAMAQIMRGMENHSLGKYELAKKAFENALRLLGTKGKDSLRARALNGIASYNRNTGDYPQALRFALQALRLYEKSGNKWGIGMAQNNIGQTYMQKGDLKSATEYLQRTLDLYRDEPQGYPYFSASHTLANVFGMGGEYAKALALDNRMIRIADSTGNEKVKTMFLDNKANCYLYSGKPDSAEYYFNECLRIDLKYGDAKQIADTYSNLGNLEISRGNFQKAESYLLRSLEIIGEVRNRYNEIKIREFIGDLYTKWGKTQKALDARNVYIRTYKQLMDERKEEALAEFRIIHETEKKEKIIAQNRIQLLEKDRKAQRQRLLLLLLAGLVVFGGFTGFLIYRQQRLRHRQQEQEHELKAAIARIETHNKLQEQRLTISRDLHDNIGAQLTFIVSSMDNLRYAFEITNAALSGKIRNISEFTQSIIVELRDTIWAMNHETMQFEDLRGRIYNFIEKARMARSDIYFRFEIDHSLDPVTFNSVFGMNLYRTIQEAVHNAIKHSGAGRVEVSVRDVEPGIEVVIRDNGSGFDTRQAMGNGLGNMRKRMADIGGDFELESIAGKGTRIRIFFEKPTV